MAVTQSEEMLEGPLQALGVSLHCAQEQTCQFVLGPPDRHRGCRSAALLLQAVQPQSTVPKQVARRVDGALFSAGSMADLLRKKVSLMHTALSSGHDHPAHLELPVMGYSGCRPADTFA